jgi:hypothetical protein
MPTSTAHVATDRPMLYLKHLERSGRSDGLTVEWGAVSEQPSTG